MTEAQAWSPWVVAFWFAWFGAFAAMEWLALRRDDDRIPPLTQVTRRWVPAIVVLPALAWLLWHGIDVYLIGGP
jgi:hypothetical protein